MRVVDGDTVEIAGTTYRLHGIDAPEAGQTCKRADGKLWPCGRQAIESLEDLVSAGGLSCDDRGADSSVAFHRHTGAPNALPRAQARSGSGRSSDVDNELACEAIMSPPILRVTAAEKEPAPCRERSPSGPMPMR